jgi:hypothetical protein
MKEHHPKGGYATYPINVPKALHRFVLHGWSILRNRFAAADVEVADPRRNLQETG